jgi:hypothetical protein
MVALFTMFLQQSFFVLHVHNHSEMQFNTILFLVFSISDMNKRVWFYSFEFRPDYHQLKVVNYTE